MPDRLDSSIVACEDVLNYPNCDDEGLRVLSRSPHPYHRQTAELVESSGSYPLIRESPLHTDSGTEADDEHFLKGLPAPKRVHKGLRGRHETSSGASTPFLAPAALLDQEGKRICVSAKKDALGNQPSHAAPNSSRRKRAREVVRRSTELLIIVALGLSVCANAQVQPILRRSSRELRHAMKAVVAVVLLYPLRLLLWAYWNRKPSKLLTIMVPPSFDPAPLFYPPTLTFLVSSLIAINNPTVLLPNIILAVSSLPPALIPTLSSVSDDISTLHWLMSCAPLVMPGVLSGLTIEPDNRPANTLPLALSVETATLLYPLHCSLLGVLHALTTTSLLTAELQLLSVALINLLLLSSSPQIVILKAILWVGGLDMLVSCSQPVQWGIALARVPKWRFRRPSSLAKKSPAFLSPLMSWRRMRHDLFHPPLDSSSCSSCEAIDDLEESDGPSAQFSIGLARMRTANVDSALSVREYEGGAVSGIGGVQDLKAEAAEVRRYTLPGTGKQRKAHSHTPSGRRKRSASISIKAFISLTYQQAVFRKWIYAWYVYLCIIGAIFVPLHTIGVKEAVMHDALRGDEPVGWALGYLFGDIQWFRWQVVSHNLGRWICLPPRSHGLDLDSTPQQGWVEDNRASFGVANTRLLLSAYCITIIAIGLIVVFRLSPVCEVDTRRKVFHFMMVAMFLPTTYIDPCFVALALAIVLAAFLLLDLLRASQLPPLSKPLAYFLAPYVDGRDLRGPVVISHIFLLIGCAIPLWLSLGSLPRTGEGHLTGWGVRTREVAMVSGVVCVGLGDAAASLIGRRYGHRKWLWSGGKSLEGSAAFATAVFLGLMAAHAWLRLGGWAATNRHVDTWQTTMRKTGACAGMASLTEAVLTGGNDNVIVPVILWTCVKSLGV